VLRVPSRTTLIGVTPDAQLSGGMRLENVEDVIVRHLRLSDAYDHLPAWDPKGNGHGEWGTANGARRMEQRVRQPVLAQRAPRVGGPLHVG